MADARYRLKQEIINVLRNSDDTLRAFRSQIENKYVIIFIGNTRNGKSTLVNYITEAPLVAFQEGNCFKIEHQVGANIGPTIGHGTLSHTTVPTIIEMIGRDMVIVDAPGFDDNRGAVQEIINALYINQIKYSKGVRFVLVSDINNIINDNINYFLSFIETVHTIMPDFVKLKDAVSIIFTKDCKNYDHVDIVKLLRAKVLDIHGLRCKKSLIKHFVEREDLIGLFKMPSAVGALTEDIDVNVHGAIFKSLPVNLNETDIKFGISKSARIILLETYLDFHELVIKITDTIANIRIMAYRKFYIFTRDQLLDLPEEHLKAENTLLKLKNHIQSHKGKPSSVTEIPNSLHYLYDVILQAAAAMEDIDIPLSKESDHVFTLNSIEYVRKKLEYIACIEKVVEKTSKSEGVLQFYKENTAFLYKEVEEFYKDTQSEMECRIRVTCQIQVAPNIENLLPEVNEQYLSASFKDELLRMKHDLEQYIKISDDIISDIQRRPYVEKRLREQVVKTYAAQEKIEEKIRTIIKHLEIINNEVLLKNVPPSVTGIMGTLMFYVGFTFITRLSQPTQFRVVAGSFLLFAAFTWKSTFVRSIFSRVRRRYQQKRLFAKHTKYDNCYRMLYQAAPRRPYH